MELKHTSNVCSNRKKCAGHKSDWTIWNDSYWHYNECLNLLFYVGILSKGVFVLKVWCMFRKIYFSILNSFPWNISKDVKWWPKIILKCVDTECMFVCLILGFLLESLVNYKYFFWRYEKRRVIINKQINRYNMDVK